MAIAPNPGTYVASKPTFAQLVSLACHDLRTPLATASGFAHTLERLDALAAPADRYVGMIGAASDQMAELLDLLGAASRIESGRFEPRLRTVNTRALADDAARRVEDGRAAVEGEGGEVRADAEWAAVSLSALAEAARRHGGLDGITLTADGAVVSITPIVGDAGAIAVGEDLRDFPAAVGARVLQTTGVRVEFDGEALRLSFPE
jgi:signal transduction histidine kinase